MGASAFNADVSKWDTTKTVKMQSMFINAVKFNRDLSKWSVFKVENLASMFYGAAAFTDNKFFCKGSWKTSALKPGDFSKSGIDSSVISNFYCDGVTTVTNLIVHQVIRDRFSGISDRKTAVVDKFGEIENWDIGALASHKTATGDCLDGLLSGIQGSDAFLNVNLTNWNTSKITSMNRWFSASTFNGDVSTWDVSRVTTMTGMFDDATAFNADISQWKTSNVINMEYLFNEATAFNADISRWDTSKVTTFGGMFTRASVFNQGNFLNLFLYFG